MFILNSIKGLFEFPSINFRALNFRAKAPNNWFKALNFSSSHIRALELKSELKCSKAFKTLEERSNRSRRNKKKLEKSHGANKKKQ